MLYLLTVKPEYDGGYDSYDSHLVRAQSEGEARALANTSTGREGKIWEDPVKVTCDQLAPDGESEIVISSFNAG